jgi:hypothetical protein
VLLFFRVFVLLLLMSKFQFVPLSPSWPTASTRLSTAASVERSPGHTWPKVWTGDITADVLVFFAERVAAEAARVAAEAARVAANKRAADAEAAIQAARVVAEAERVAAQAERVAAFDLKLNAAANTTLNACKSFYNSSFLPLGQSKSANSAATSSLSTKGGDERPIAAD